MQGGIMLQTSKYHATETDLLNEQAIIQAAKQKPEKFALLYDKYYEQIFRFIYQRVDDKDAAFDATQQVFMKAIQNLPKYEYRGVPFASWLYRIASSEVNNLFRAQKAQRTVNIDSVNVYVMIEEMQESKIEKYHDKIVEIIGNELEEDELQLIEMRFFEKRAFKEIAEILDMTENNAKVKTYRILEKLKKRIK
jgi:RNA polymerase sigma-70 factor (ECF subfamily)